MVTTGAATREQILELLDEVQDPELPFVSIMELGIVRDVLIGGEGVEIVITPTYSGCPAMSVIERDILSRLAEAGISNVSLHTIYSPAWTSEWLTESARTKFREAGIAPPRTSDIDSSRIEALVSLRRGRATAECPYCGSSNTEERSEFGSTACKAIHFCCGCHQPFDRFKAI